MNRRERSQRLIAVALTVAAFAGWRLSLHAIGPVVWNKGDVFAGVSNGTYNVYDGATGVLKDQITDPVHPTDFTVGCAFNNDFTKLYTAEFLSNEIVVYDDAVPHSI